MHLRAPCPYCGNNPVSHSLTRVSTRVELMLGAGTEARTGFFERIAARAAKYTLACLVGVLRALGLVRMSEDAADAFTGRGRVLIEEAKRRGLRAHGLLFLGIKTDAYRVEASGKTLYYSGFPRPLFTESGSDKWLDDKALLKQRLAAAGIPVPEGGVFRRIEDLRRFYERLGRTLVVKPRIGSRGRHTTTHIRSPEDLAFAFGLARELCRDVVAEEHLMGSVYRGTVIDGKLVGVLRGDPPRVVGDGRNAIEELVGVKNATKHPKVADVVLCDIHDQFLARTGRTRSTTPAFGEVVDLLEKIGISYGGFSAEEIEKTHPKMKRILEEAARVVDDPFIGFDFITSDVAADPREVRWGIIEANSLPFIDLHHFPLEGEPINVAAHVWDYVERNIHRY